MGNFVFVNPKPLSFDKERVEDVLEVKTMRIVLVMLIGGVVTGLVDVALLHVTFPLGIGIVHKVMYMTFGGLICWAGSKKHGGV